MVLACHYSVLDGLDQHFKVLAVFLKQHVVDEPATSNFCKADENFQVVFENVEIQTQGHWVCCANATSVL